MFDGEKSSFRELNFNNQIIRLIASVEKLLTTAWKIVYNKIRLKKA